MSQDIIHVYLMPGMAANPCIFENIKLPENQFQMHWLEWVIPHKKESLSDYAKRMVLKIKHEHVVLLGVSFGGVLVQEMSKHVTLRKLIIVSSVKTKYEMPNRMKVVRLTKAYKVLPTGLASNIDMLAKYAFGNAIKKRVAIYKRYLSVSDKRYLDWAITHMVCWDQEEPIAGCVHIHGDYDRVFPYKNIIDCIKVKGGTHIMVINKFRWFNENLPQIIMQ